MKKTIQTSILELIEAAGGSGISMQEIGKKLELESSKDFKILVKTVAQMEHEHQIEFTKSGKLKTSQPDLLLEGVFHSNDKGFGFVKVDLQEDDIYIAEKDTLFAMDGDTVAVDIIKPADVFQKQSAEGKIIKIIQRKNTQLVGEFFAYTDDEVANTELYGYVLANQKKIINIPIYIVAEGIKPEAGSICIVEITAYPEETYPDAMEGYVTKVVGHKDDPGIDILGIVLRYGIPIEFPDDVLEQANQVPDKIDAKDLLDRKDCRNQMIVTIDGADAKDLDDAVTVQRLENGNYFLGVHIADVSYYVTENSELDKEAYERGTSVYLTDRVIPMLPRRLSNGICSLNPQVDRLVLSCEMEIDSAGNVVQYTIGPSVIKTTARMTYTAVNEILEEKKADTIATYQNLVPMFQDMEQLHYILEKMRERRGAIQFDDREATILVDEDGKPTDIKLRSRGVGERLIESFMLIANETVAKHFEEAHLPFIYRIHESPKEEKMQRFLEMVTNFGVIVKGTKDSVSPKMLQQVLDQVAGTPEEAVISTMMLRSMQQARYSEDNYGHYGLAAEYYTHFTSPIRRYPDLIVHRLIRAYGSITKKATTEKNKLIEKWQEQLPEIADHSSNMERRAVDAERETDSLKKAEYMADKIGEKYEGVISSVTKFGLFIELPNTVEGLVHVSTIDWDYFIYDERHLELRGESTGQTYKIGQVVPIEVIKADPTTQEIDFALVADETQKVQAEQRKQNRRNRNQRRQSDRRKADSRNSHTKKSKKSTSESGSKKTSNKHQETSKGKKKKKNNSPFYKSVNKKKKGKKNR